MKTEVTNVSQCVHELTITVDAKTALADYGKTLNKIARYVQVPGFRKGKAPVAMLERMYGDAAKDQFFTDQLEEYFKKAAEETKINPISTPQVTKQEWEKGQDLVAVFTYEVAPTPSCDNYENLTVVYKPRTVGQDDVNNYIEELRRKNGYHQPSEAPIEQEDLIKISLSYEGLSNPIEREVSVGFNQFGEDFNQSVIGLKVGDDFEAEIFSGENAKQANGKILEVKRLVMPELNDDFAKDLEFDSVEQMREKILKEMEQQNEAGNRRARNDAIFRALIEANPFDLPPTQVEQVAMEQAKQGATQYKVKAEQLMPLYRPMAEFQIKQYYLMTALLEKLNPEVSEEDKKAAIEEAATNMQMSVEEYTEKYAKILEGQDFADSLKERKVFDTITASATFVEEDPNQPEQPEANQDLPADDMEEIVIDPD